VTVLRREMIAAVGDPDGRKANCCVVTMVSNTKFMRLLLISPHRSKTLPK